MLKIEHLSKIYGDKKAVYNPKTIKLTQLHLKMNYSKEKQCCIM